MAEGILNPIPQLEADFDFDVYTKQEVDALLDTKADKVDTYTKTETDTLLSAKADADNVYTKTETDNLLSAKADKSTTLAGYGITDAYTKTETDNLLNGKADADSVYTKQEIDTKIPSSVGSATKSVYVNGGVVTECTHELNKTVPANAVFTDTTYSAGNGLNLSGTSFSAKAGTNVTVDASGINVNGSGTVASADSGLINGGTAYTELRPTLDGTWVKNAQTTATNLQKLEGGIEYLYGLLTHQYDQLKKYINGNYYDYHTDTDSKYTKSVPAGAMPYASLEQIGGKTLVWNQLIENGNFADATGWTTSTGITMSVANNVLTATATTSSYATVRKSSAYTVPLISGHKYYITAVVSSTSGVLNVVPFNSVSAGAFAINNATSPTRFEWIYTSTQTNNASMDIRLVASVNGTEETITATISNYMCVDLTLMYGSGNEPTTVEEFQQMFPAQYYPYNAGTLLSAGVTEVVSKDANDTTLQTVSIPAEVQALEGYGWSAGSVYNYIDYERKVFVQMVASYTFYGTETWTYYQQGDKNTFNSGNRFLTDVKKFGNGIMVEYTKSGAQYIASQDNLTFQFFNTPYISIRNDAYTDATTFASYMSGKTLYYELATPIETDISAYLTDDNLIEVESGGTLTFENQNGDDYRIDVPSAETYMVDLQSALGE